MLSVQHVISNIYFKKIYIEVKESPINELSYWRKNKEVRWVRRLYWALLLDWAYFSILRFVGLGFEPSLYSLTMRFSSPVWPFLFLHFFISFSTRLGNLSSSFFSLLLPCRALFFYSFFAAWLGFLLLLLFGLNFVALSLYIKYF